METYTREVYRAIGASGSEFTFVGLVSAEGAKLDLSWFPGEIVETGISGEKRVEWAIGELWRIAGRAVAAGADLIHSPATLGPASTRVPLVVTMHDMLYWSHPELMSTPLFTKPVKWMERRVASTASRIITISEVSKREIVKYLGVAADHVDVIALAGTAPDVAARTPDTDHPFLLASGNRRPHKNFDGLIRALALVPEEIRPRLIIGGSHGEDPLAAIVEETGLHDFVELRSWLTAEELGDLYSRATALAVPSFAEGFSLPPLEAMMVGLPVLVSDIEVHHEVCGDAALYVDPHDPSAIAAGITRIVTEQGLASTMSGLGLERAAEFTWASTAEHTLDAFRSVLA
ncbi:glycosyltransferase family 4 protein [Plantibacter sp. Mn2098]|uniref:glycosyltransferase family 4 protein n=1 Tax=Plantibacter sp. Mn2098 TaxID=3395266 RepID=UPI003BE00356